MAVYVLKPYQHTYTLISNEEQKREDKRIKCQVMLVSTIIASRKDNRFAREKLTHSRHSIQW